jgi:membrane-associated phospholipid phosphatase
LAAQMPLLAMRALPLEPQTVAICVSTVYSRYHYMADVLAGIAVGAMGFSVGTWLMRRRGALPGTKASVGE